MIRFRFQPTVRDYRAVLGHLFGFKGGRMLNTAGAIIFLYWLTSPLTAHGVGGWQGAVAILQANLKMLVIPGVCLGLLIFRTYITFNLLNKFKTTPEMNVEREYRFDKSGIHTKSDLFSSNTAWDTLTEADCNRGYIFLKAGPQVVFYFPKSILPDEKAFAELIGAKVAPSARWKRQYPG